MAQLYIGLSGFSYPTWKGEGRFYPADVPATKFLQYYTTRYNALEMDGTFYKNPTENSVAEWIKKTPDHFKFSFKMHQRVSHHTRLKAEGIEAVKFMLSRLVPMAKADRLGPLLIQLPPNFKRHDERLLTFLEQLPQDFGDIDGGSSEDKVRWGMEFRNEGWNVEEVEEMLRKFNVGWVASDMDEQDAQRRDTGPYIQARLRKSEYSDEALMNWANYFSAALQRGKDCYVYCKHEDEGSPWIWADFLLKHVRPSS
jgi:uncharacterized protein YecE (DUF72 family)